MKLIVKMVIETDCSLKPQYLYDTVTVMLKDEDIGHLVKGSFTCDIDMDDLLFSPLEFIEYALMEAKLGDNSNLEKALEMVESLKEHEACPSKEVTEDTIDQILEFDEEDEGVDDE